MAQIRHSAVLTREEHRSVQLHPELRRRLPRATDGAAVRVLDWGCGRGSDVLHLRRQGFDAHGVEPHVPTIERGRPLFAAEGLELSHYVRPLGEDNRTSHPDAWFDFLISYQVLEHVADLDSAAREMHRVLKPGGVAIHVYPAHRRPVEGHLRMPLVHWLPKNGTRRAAIGACVRLGIHARWPELASATAAERTTAYYAYSCRATHYRAPGAVLRIFGAAGFDARFESHRHPRVQRLALARALPEALLGWVLTNFAGCTLVCRRR